MPNIDLKYARSNTTGTSEHRERRRGESELLSDRNGSPSVRSFVRPSGRPSGRGRLFDGWTDADADGRTDKA